MRDAPDKMPQSAVVQLDGKGKPVVEISPKFLNQPMILITQIQRSGGTLISQLFDGHPQIYAHPHELHIGYPEKWHWPQLSLSDDPKVWFNCLYEERLEQFYGKGYYKPGMNSFALKEVHPFSFDPKIQQAVFSQGLKFKPPNSQREILNIYYTSFFAAWSDTPTNPGGRYISAFCPRILMFPDSTERFIRDYPDGHIVSSVRDPRTWYASASRHAPAYEDVREAIGLWRMSTTYAIRLKKMMPDYIFLTSYEKLVSETEDTMRRMATFLGIDFDNSLLMPTYVSKPILPNSSYERKSYGVNADSTKTAAQLNDRDRAYIEEKAMPLYEEAVSL